MIHTVECPTTGGKLTIEAPRRASITIHGEDNRLEDLACELYRPDVPWAVCPDAELLLRYRRLFDLWHNYEGDKPDRIDTVARVWQHRDSLATA